MPETTIVEVGGTVYVHEEASGTSHIWTIVSTRSDSSSGKISTDTAVAKALLGHRIGETVAVAVAGGSARRYVIDRIDPAPAKPRSVPSTAAASRPAASAPHEIVVFGPGQ